MLFMITGPERTLLLMEDGNIIAFITADEAEKHYEIPYLFNKSEKVQRYDRLTFSERTNGPDLLPDDTNETLDISTKGLFSALKILANNRENTTFELPADLDVLFERRFNCWNKANHWCDNTLPVLFGYKQSDGFNFALQQEMQNPLRAAFWNMLARKTSKSQKHRYSGFLDE
ncbi:hypothetical protein [Facklamia sp. P12950]|uniref:hypothetical protein n=1 Tax=Facklamia sp. P12950 TaxID=3421951 RepID=UPI003D1684A6